LSPPPPTHPIHPSPARLPAALQQGRIRGAALDVFYTEPLPADSPLWGLPNVLMSPHCADRTKEFQFESLQLFLQNLRRYVAGQEPANVCNKRAGY
jgi:phosphoglycerate dehydrogenase-like enzyme